jgi:hypothetical protein
MIDQRLKFLGPPILVAILIVLPASVAHAQMASSSWPQVPPVDWSKLKPEDFSDDELDLPYYLGNFHKLANSVVETGENRGFMDLSVWRSPQDNKPYNARIMENILSLAFFYSTGRPWNQYYESPALRVRLEAALSFWCKIQSPDGRFSEYGPQQWNLAATAFATKFMGQTLTLLRSGPRIDQVLMAQVAAADRRAIEIVLTDPDLYRHGKVFTNQYTNMWAGAVAYLSLYPDAKLAAEVHRNIRENSGVFQSPAGYFYEARGPDWGYNLGTHHSNLAITWHYLRSTDLRSVLAQEEKDFVEWLTFNAVREPDGSGFTLNREIETRQRHAFLDTEALLRGQEEQGQRLIGSEVPMARAFLPTQDQVNSYRARRRAELQQNWTKIKDAELGTFSAFSPYAFLHRAFEKWYPSAAQRDAALKALPYVRPSFTHQRMDGRERLVFTFVRRPAYYAIFNSGPHLTSQQRFGLGLVWNPQFGSMLQSQTGSDDGAWGTFIGDRQAAYEADSLDADFSIDGRMVNPFPGKLDLPAGVLTVKYRFTDQGDKTITFRDREMIVEVHHSGPLRENIPLLVGIDDKLAVTPGEVLLSRAGKQFAIRFNPETKATTVETGLKVGPRRVVTIQLRSLNDLSYRLDCSSL